ncbi:hypothetical protein V491_08490, partial [Pseudogymnoascus sp. VKM F-3775]
AFLSPGAGGRPVLMRGLFLIFADREPLCVCDGRFFFTFAVALARPAARTAVVVEKADTCALVRAYGDAEEEGLIRHFQQFVEAIANAWIGELWWVGWVLSKVGVSRVVVVWVQLHF